MAQLRRLFDETLTVVENISIWDPSVVWGDDTHVYWSSAYTAIQTSAGSRVAVVNTRTFNENGVALDRRFFKNLDPMESAYLAVLGWFPQFDPNQINVRFDTQLGTTGSAAGPELLLLAERDLRFCFRHGTDLLTVAITGDPTEPYNFTPTNIDEVNTFFGRVDIGDTLDVAIVWGGADSVIDLGTLTTTRGGSAPVLDKHELTESLEITDQNTQRTNSIWDPSVVFGDDTHVYWSGRYRALETSAGSRVAVVNTRTLNANGVALDRRFFENLGPMESAYLAVLGWFPHFDPNQINIRFDTQLGTTGSAAGPELLPLAEQGLRFCFRSFGDDISLLTVAITGDMTEPYNFTPTNIDEVNTFFGQVHVSTQLDVAIVWGGPGSVIDLDALTTARGGTAPVLSGHPRQTIAEQITLAEARQVMLTRTEQEQLTLTEQSDPLLSTEQLQANTEQISLADTQRITLTKTVREQLTLTEQSDPTLSAMQSQTATEQIALTDTQRVVITKTEREQVTVTDASQRQATLMRTAPESLTIAEQHTQISGTNSIWDPSVVFGDDTHVYWSGAYDTTQTSAGSRVAVVNARPLNANTVALDRRFFKNLGTNESAYLAVLGWFPHFDPNQINVRFDTQLGTTGSAAGPELLLLAERDLRFCFRVYKSGNPLLLTVAITGDPTEPYNFTPTNIDEVNTFFGQVDIFDRIHVAIVWGGAGSVIDFNTLTTARGGTAPLLDAHVLSESLAFTDASQIIRLSHQQESVSLTDTQRAAVTKIERARLTIGETRETTVDRTTGERVSLTDARRAAVTRTAREQLTLTEQSTPILSSVLLQSDTEQISLADVQQVTLTTVTRERLTVADTRQVTLTRTEQEQVTLTEQSDPTISSVLLRADTEQISLADTQQVTLTRTEQEQLTLTEQSDPLLTEGEEREDITLTETHDFTLTRTEDEEITVADASERFFPDSIWDPSVTFGDDTHVYWSGTYTAIATGPDSRVAVVNARSSNANTVALDRKFFRDVAPSESAYLAVLGWFPHFDPNQINIRFDTQLGTTGSVQGPELLLLAEQGLRFCFRHGTNLLTVAIAVDASEPYNFTPTNIAEVNTFFGRVDILDTLDVAIVWGGAGSVINFVTLTTARGGSAPVLDRHILTESLVLTEESESQKAFILHEQVTLSEDRRVALTHIEETRLTLAETSDPTLLADTTPDPFVFVQQTGIPRRTYIISNEVTITGISDGTPLSIVGGGGAYHINGRPEESVPTTINNGDTVQVAVLSSSAYHTQTFTTLTIGTESALFSVVTETAPYSVAVAPNFRSLIDIKLSDTVTLHVSDQDGQDEYREYLIDPVRIVDELPDLFYGIQQEQSATFTLVNSFRKLLFSASSVTDLRGIPVTVRLVRGVDAAHPVRVHAGRISEVAENAESITITSHTKDYEKLQDLIPKQAITDVFPSAPVGEVEGDNVPSVVIPFGTMRKVRLVSLDRDKNIGVFRYGVVLKKIG